MKKEKEKVIKVGVVCFREHDMTEPVIEFKEIENELSCLQGLVGGNIEIPFISKEFSEANIKLIINEKGKLEDLGTTILLINKKTLQVLDDIRGNVILSSNEGEELTSLSDEQVELIKTKFLNNVAVIADGREQHIVFAMYI